MAVDEALSSTSRIDVTVRMVKKERPPEEPLK
jgi:hypothetical protein